MFKGNPHRSFQESSTRRTKQGDEVKNKAVEEIEQRCNDDTATKSTDHAFKLADFSLRSPTSSVCTDITSPSSFNGTATEIPGIDGWASSPRLRDGWGSRTTLNTNTSADSPITPMSPVDHGCPFRRTPSPSPSFVSDTLDTSSIPLSLPMRPKPEEEPVTPHLGPTAAPELLVEPLPRETTPRLKETCNKSQKSPTSASLNSPSIVCELAGDEAFTSTPAFRHGPAEDILKYTLRETFSSAYVDISASLTACNAVVRNFVSDITWALDQDTSAYRQVGGVHRNSTNASSSTTVTRSSQHSSTSSSRSDKGKRKAGSNKDGNEDNNEDDFDGNDGYGSRRNSTKRAKVEKPLRMSCPYRKKNPLRFNVRDHRLCAMTVFDNTSELRRHIQDCHKRLAVSPHACPRCRTQFGSTEALRQHVLYLTGLCPINEDFTETHDPEDGIDEETAEKLRTKRGRVSDPIDVQWEKIWDLLFPNIPVQPYDYCAVMEHFELYDKYRESIPSLKANLSGLGLGDRGLETLGYILDNHFIGLFESCNEEGRRKDYRNRQPKIPSSTLGLPRSTQSLLRRRLNRDSACEIVMEERAGFYEQGMLDESLAGICGLTDTTLSREHTISQDPSPQTYPVDRDSSRVAPVASFEPLPTTVFGIQDPVRNETAFLGVGSVPDLNDIGIHQWNELNYSNNETSWIPPNIYCSQFDSGSHEEFVMGHGRVQNPTIPSQYHANNGVALHSGPEPELGCLKHRGPPPR